MELLIPIIIYGALIIGPVYQLIKVLVILFRRYKFDCANNKGLTAKLKIGFTLLGIAYGCIPIFLILQGLFPNFVGIQISKRTFMILALAYVPYFAVSFGLGYGIGKGSSYSGISAEKMYDSLELKCKNKKTS
jgi:hypothetical protein